jgi:hypothetical protein
MTSVPADADPRAHLPFGYVTAHLIQESHDFVAGDTRELNSGESTHLGE